MSEMIEVSVLMDWLAEQAKSREGELRLTNDVLADYSLKGTLLRGLLPTVQAIELDKIKEICERLKEFPLTGVANSPPYEKCKEDLLKECGE